MAKQNKNVSIEIDAAALKTLRCASSALSELASAAVQAVSDDPDYGSDARRGASHLELWRLATPRSPAHA